MRARFWVRDFAGGSELPAAEFADDGEGRGGVPLCASEEANERSKKAVPVAVYLPHPVPLDSSA